MSPSDIRAIIKEVCNPDQPLRAATVYGLSELSQADSAILRDSWPTVPVERRHALLARLIEASETDLELNYHAVNRIGLSDDDEEVRLAAIEGSWEDDNLDVMRVLIRMAAEDPAAEVRAAAVKGLGRFILLGELGKLPHQETRHAEDMAISLFANRAENPEVRRRALESAANCGHPKVAGMVEEAYRADQPLAMRASAVFAMGRSYDEAWSDAVLRELTSPDGEMRYEAARAAGELELDEAVPSLGDLMSDEDREVLEMAIWALGEIGSPEAQRLLESAHILAEENRDDGLLEPIEEALDAASLMDLEFRFDE